MPLLRSKQREGVMEIFWKRNVKLPDSQKMPLQKIFFFYLDFYPKTESRSHWCRFLCWLHELFFLYKIHHVNTTKFFFVLTENLYKIYWSFFFVCRKLVQTAHTCIIFVCSYNFAAQENKRRVQSWKIMKFIKLTNKSFLRIVDIFLD